MMKKNLLLMICMVGSCYRPANLCKTYNYQNQFDYEVHSNEITEEGVEVDTSGLKISIEEIDELIDETEECLITEFGNPPVIPPEVMQNGQCWNDTFDIPFNRGCYTVKIANDWIWSCDGTQQLLPYEAPQELCQNKGLIADPKCPCRWRAGIQDNHIIVTTPNMALFKDPLIRLTTGCNNPWGHPRLAKCTRVK